MAEPKPQPPGAEELIGVLARASAENEEGALTTGEIYNATGWSMDRIRRTLAAAISAGLVEVVYVWRTGIDGRPHKLPAYRPRKDR